MKNVIGGTVTKSQIARINSAMSHLLPWGCVGSSALRGVLWPYSVFAFVPCLAPFSVKFPGTGPGSEVIFSNVVLAK